MKNILHIFRTDLKRLFRNFFALVIALGLCFLPALYAWFNIYANWNPYGNTKNIKIAVVNLDKGAVDSEGNENNMGDGIVKSLKKKDNIGFVFLDSKTDAVDGVKSGKYYASFVIEEDFTNDMYTGAFVEDNTPSITYYLNDKKNAVAVKITDSAMSTLQNTINETYVKTVVKKIADKANSASKELEDKMENDDVVSEFLSSLAAVDSSLVEYDEMVETLIKANNDLSSAGLSLTQGLKEAVTSIDSAKKAVNNGKKDIKATKKTFKEFSENLVASMSALETAMRTISDKIEKASLMDDVYKMDKEVNDIVDDINGLDEDLNDIRAIMYSMKTTNDREHTQTVKNAIQAVDEIRNLLSYITVVSEVDIDEERIENNINAVRKKLDNYAGTINKISTMYDKQVVVQVNLTLDNMSKSLDSLSVLLDSLGKTCPGIISTISKVDDSIGLVDSGMGDLKNKIKEVRTKIAEVTASVEGISADKRLLTLVTLLQGDSEEISRFFSSPVAVEDNYIYEIKNYGSGVSPFYTTLAIWFGMTVLVSMIKVQAKGNGFTLNELYFGRYLLFFVLSQIQTLIIVLGNLYLLKIQCLHPFRFWLAASITSVTISIVVYTLTLSFGDIGKAVAVVLMVMQIAGSGGTFPIEALPDFFKNVYIFFPFPYAIDAMRECIGGMYYDRYAILLVKLCVFIVAALFVGLFVRKPFISFNHYIEKRMEDTKML